MSYFSGCITKDDVKARFWELAKKHHPDKNGGTDEAKQKMQEINSAYAFAMSQAIKGEAPDSSPESQAQESELMERIRKAVEFACGLPDVDVTLRGLWVWVEGETKAVKEQLKENGFSWLNQKKCWVFKGVRSFNRGKSWTTEQIEERYGAKSFKRQATAGVTVRGKN